MHQSNEMNEKYEINLLVFGSDIFEQSVQFELFLYLAKINR